MMQQPVKIVNELINQEYQDYLQYLEEKNRQRAYLRKKSREARRIEKLEQGFNLFFNVPTPDIHHRRTKSRDPYGVGPWTDESMSSPDEFGRKATGRTKSAPGSKQKDGQRRTWGPVAIPRCSQSSKGNHKVLGPTSSSRTTPRSAMTDCFPSEKKSQRSRSYIHESKSCSDLHFNHPIVNSTQLTVHLDFLSCWNDQESVGFQEAYLETEEKKPCSIVDVELLKLNAYGQVTCDLFDSEKTHMLQDPISCFTKHQPWMIDSSAIPFRLVMRFAILQTSDGCFYFGLVNLPSRQNSVPSGIKCIRLEFIFPSKETSSIETIMKPDEAMKLLVNFERKKVEFVKEDDSAIRINANSSRGDCYESRNTESWPFNSHGDKLENPASRMSHLLDGVSTELLDKQWNRNKQKDICKRRDRFNSLLECSWSSLDFFDHFHAGRLNIDAVAHQFNAETHRGSHVPQQTIPSQSIMHCESMEPEDNERDSASFTLQPRPNELNIPVPELPQGSTLVFDIVSTWGDIYYVGLSGLEVFTSDGIDIAPSCAISADPPDINILPGYGTDPRIVSNLIDGVNWTRDDTHMWLAPFNPGERHLIFLQLPRASNPIAMIRVWNYNKSRVHTSRGVKELVIYLDQSVIFYGEISRALGLESSDPTDFYETILFTTDDDILELIAKNDKVIHLCQLKHKNIGPEKTLEPENRPQKRVQPGDVSVTCTGPESLCQSPSETTLLSDLLKAKEDCAYIDLELIDPWERSANRIGLTGIKLKNEAENEIRITQIMATEACEEEEGCLSALLDDTNETNDLQHMWSCFFQQDKPPVVRIFYPRGQIMKKLQVWNHNGERSLTNYGVRRMRIRDELGNYLGSRQTTDGSILLRIAPGHTKFSLVQNIDLKQGGEYFSGKNHEQTQQTDSLPCGFVVRVDILSTWSDRYYVGLDGLELLTIEAKPLKICPISIFASPSSTNDLIWGGMSKHIDVRTVDKLVDGVTSGVDMSSHCWLAPIDSNHGNQIFIVFDEPVPVSGLRLWNYSRNVERGVREFSVFIDDRILFRGFLPKAFTVGEQSQSNRCDRKTEFREETVLPLTGKWLSKPAAQQSYVVLFEPSYAPLVPEYPHYVSGIEDPSGESSKLFTTDTIKMINIESESSKPKLFSRTQLVPANPELRPFTCVMQPRMKL